MASVNSGFDILNRYQDVNGDDYSAYVNRHEEEEKLKQLYEDKGTLDFQDMLQLMVAQFQNQTMDDQASTTDMMNQLVQMSTMQAMNEMSSQMSELTLANVMSYSRSLVGQEVTVGVWQDVPSLNEDGTITTVRKLEEIYDKVVGVGNYGGQQVIFLEKGGMYYLSDILAVGKLPKKEETEDPETPEIPEDPEVKIPDNLDSGFLVDDKDSGEDKVNPDNTTTGSTGSTSGSNSDNTPAEGSGED